MPPIDPRALNAAVNSLDDVARVAFLSGRAGAVPNPGVKARKNGKIDPKTRAELENLHGLDRVEGSMDALDRGIGQAGMIPMIPQFIFPLAGGALGWLGSRTGISAFDKVHGGLNAVANARLMDIPAPNFVRRAGGWMSQKFMNGVGLLADGLTATGFTGWRANAAERALGNQRLKMATHADLLPKLVGGAHAEVQSGLDRIGELLRNGNPAHMCAMEGGEFKQLLESTGKAAEKNGLTHVGSWLGKAGSLGDHAHTLHTKMDGYRNLGKYARETGALMGTTNAWHGMMNASFIAGGVTMASMTAIGAAKSMGVIREIYADLTKTDPREVTTIGVLTSVMSGTAPKAVSAAFYQAARQFGPAALLDAGNLAYNVRAAAHHKLGSMLMLMALPFGSIFWKSMVVGNIIPAYTAAKEMEVNGQPIPPELYAEVIGQFCPELRQAGGSDKTSNFAKALGVIYAAEAESAAKNGKQFTLADVMREGETGEAWKRVQALQKEADAKLAAKEKNGPKKEAHPETHKEAHPGHSPQNLVEKRAQAEAVGTHSRKLVDQAKELVALKAAGQQPAQLEKR